MKIEDSLNLETVNRKKRKLAAIMFADIVGYTAMMQENEILTKKIRDAHRKTLTESVEAHGGTILQFYGDGSLSIFDSAVEAAGCAVKIQLESQNDPKVPLRIGIHTGDVVVDEEGAFGDGVNVASRIESLAITGSVMISDKVYDEIKNHTAYRTLSMGEFELKNVARPVEAFAIINEGLIVPKRNELKGKVKESIKSIAVMPFMNMSADPENEYFSDGITEELINAMTRVEGLMVTSRTSSFSFKGKNEDVRSIGEKLNVQSILEGSVRKSGNRVRITAQLINVADGYHVWSESFDRNLEDIFEVQDEISQTIANKLREKLSIKEKSKPLVISHTDNFQAYNHYLMGLFHYNKWTPANAVKAIGHYEKAIQEEPNFSLPYVGMARSYSLISITGYRNPKEAAEKAIMYGNKALSMDSNNIDAYLVLAVIQYFYKWDWGQGFLGIQKAIEINPNSSEAHLLYSLHYAIKGRIEEALEAMDKSYQIDPVSFNTIRTLADMYYFAERYDEAIAVYDSILEQDPHFLAAIEFKAWAYLMKGDTNQAIALFLSMGAEGSHAIQADSQLAYAYSQKGDEEQARAYLSALEKKGTGSNFDYAIIYAGLHDLDNAFHHLEKCYEERLGTIIFIKVSPIWKPLRKDKRYLELLERLNLN
ncbi:MAG: tetratricopeptide repeat protein [Cyclobacteriaceae bacterium]